MTIFRRDFPSAIVKEFVTKNLDTLVTSKNVLDLGSSNGINSIFFAKRKFDVVAVDKNRAALLELYNYSSSLNIEVVCDDIFNFISKNNRTYGIIMCLATMYFLDKSSVPSFIGNMKNRVRDSGFIIITTKCSDSNNRYLTAKEMFNFFPRDKWIFHLFETNDGADGLTNVRIIVQKA